MFLCCQARSSGTTGQVTLLTGTNTALVAKELSTIHGALTRTSALQPLYLPGQHVPCASMGLGAAEIVEHSARTAALLGGSGFQIVLHGRDPTQFLTHVAAKELEKAPVQVLTALSYLPIRSLSRANLRGSDLARSLVDFGVAFRTTPNKSARSVGYVKQSDVLAALERASAAIGPHTASALRELLLPSMFPAGSSARGMFFEPRNDYDVVVDATNPSAAARAVAGAHAAARRQASRSAVYGLSASPRPMPSCQTCQTASTDCVGCLHALRSALARQPASLGGSELSVALPLQERVYRVPEPEPHFARDPKKIYFWQRDGGLDYPFLNLRDATYAKVEGVLGINGPFWDEGHYKKFLEYKAQGNKFIGISSFEQFPGQIEDPNDTEMARTKKVFDDKEFRESVIGWLHCFHEPEKVLPADMPYMMLPESDLLDPKAYIANPDEEKLYDFYYYTHTAEGWEAYVRNWEVGKKCVQLMAEKYNLKVVLAGIGNNEKERPNHPNITNKPLLAWNEYIDQVVRKSRYCFIASIADPSPRTPIEGMLLGCPVLENANIIGGWHYVAPQTGMTWDGTVEGFERSLVAFLEKAKAGGFSPREWYSKRFGRKRAGARLYDWANMLPGFPKAAADEGA